MKSGWGAIQPFTSKERDAETGLDYFGARYMSSAQGRFTSPDPLLSSGRPWDPQSWNRYSYVLNNPLRYTDPLGLYIWDGSLGGDTSDDEVRKNHGKKQANQIIGRRNDIRGSLAAGAKINDPRVQAASGAYGAEGTANGVAVAMGKLSGNTAAQVGPGSPPVLASADGQSVAANMIVTFDFSKVSGANDLVVNAAHEGQHMLDRQTFVGSTLADPNAFGGPLNLTTYQTEVNAYTTGAAAFRSPNPNSGSTVRHWIRCWPYQSRRGAMESHRKILVLSCIRNEVFDEKPVRVSANSNRFVRLHFLGTAQQDQVLLVEAVAPVYPMVAVYSSTKGEVMVKLTIDKTGAVSGAKVIQGHRLLAVSAEEAARKWRFTAGSGDTQIAVAFVFRILPKGPPDAELATRFRTPYQMEIRRVIPDASTNSDPASDPPRRKAK